MNPFQFKPRVAAEKTSGVTKATKFVNLAPTADADETGIYREALEFALNDDEVFNIALTGPYGSGKSSVIKSFLAGYRGKPLQLSLASFFPDGEAGVNVTKQEIERSILQQLLYGASADKLPLSRFKRIQMPNKFSALISLFVAIGLASVYYLFTKRSELLSGKLLEPFDFSNWFNLLTVTIGLIFGWRVIHTIYVKSLGLSLKSISLKDVQITPDTADSESILNRHLDEIIYFFQSTDYDLVVIEDLDRFENPDIFVNLREINGLLNANAGVGRRIRFLYALRDDIFINTDRTKFFEFIVPVIPVINHSNSIDKVLEHGKRVDLDKQLDRQFIRDVSRYLSDLRMIGNIFNEYVVYSKNLKSDDGATLNPNKMLAILIYKNVIPEDFAALHRQEGTLSKVLDKYEEYVTRIETRLKGDVTAIETELANGEAQSLRDHSELRKVYAMAIVEKMPFPCTILHTSQMQIGIAQLAQEAELEIVLRQKGSVPTSSVQGHTNRVNLQDLEASVDPTRSYAVRKAEIEAKSMKYKDAADKKLRSLRGEIASLRTRKFNEVIRESAQLTDDVFSGVGENRELLKFLILEGHLDDNYYQYISLFHSGRLSPNDNRFLIRIRAYENPDPDFHLDNVGEVIASMREEDFGQQYVLNNRIIDHLFDDPEKYSGRVKAACGFIATNFEKCDGFFVSYYARGLFVNRLISALIQQWPMFATRSLDSEQSTSHAARILAHAPEDFLSKPSALEFAKYISMETLAVLEEEVSFELKRLDNLKLKIVDLPSIANYADVVAKVASRGLYHISNANIRHIMKTIVGWEKLDDLNVRHYSVLLEANHEAILKRINADFETYVRDVLLGLVSNTKEDFSSVIAVLSRVDIELELRTQFLKTQTAIFPSLKEVPAEFHELLFELRLIDASWENCIAFLSLGEEREVPLTIYLQGGETSVKLARQPIPSGEDAKPLRLLLIGNRELPDEIYASYLRQLPSQFRHFPDVQDTKIEALIDERKIEFSPESFMELKHVEHRVLFLVKDFESYLGSPASYKIDDGFRTKLLASSLTDRQKLKVVEEIDVAFITANASVAGMIGPILDRLGAGITKLGSEFAQAVIVNTPSEEIQISLLNKLHAELSDEEVRNVLKALPDPYCDLTVLGRWARLKSDEANEKLASWLKERNLISSYSTFGFGSIRINNFRKDY